jgi:type IV secretory pathway TraG/TraD family ATPase VirD4
MTAWQREFPKCSGKKLSRRLLQPAVIYQTGSFPRPLIDAADLLKLEKDGQYLVVSSTYPVRVSRTKSWLDYPEETKLPSPVIEPLEIDDLEEMCRKESMGAGGFKKPAQGLSK